MSVSRRDKVLKVDIIDFKDKDIDSCNSFLKIIFGKLTFKSQTRLDMYQKMSFFSYCMYLIHSKKRIV